MLRRFGAVLAACFLGLMALPALACGPESKCMIGDRHYQIAMPEGHDGSTLVPAVIWAHGYRGTSAGVMRNGSLRRMVHAEGFALIALEAVAGSWDLPNGPRNMASTGEAEFAYVDAVIADASERFSLDTSRLVASGFSAGAMLTWNLACTRPDAFAGFVPISGTFWLQPPARCETPVESLVHVHGDADRTVPLKGRAIGPTRQGKVEAALEMYGGIGGFGPAQAARMGPLACRSRVNVDGELLDFCLFEGGHSFRTEYLRLGLQRLVETGQL